MKPLRSALLLSFCIALGASVPARAEAKPYSGTSSSYKSGFSSQKGNTARSRPSAPPANRQSGPGAFGKAPGSPASAYPRNGSADTNTSAASRDLDRSAAQARALKNLDERRAAAAAPTPLPPLNDTPMRATPMRPGAPAPLDARAPVAAPPGYPQQVIVQQPSSGLMHGVLGFMLGRAMSQANQPVAYPTTTATTTAPTTATPAGGAPAPVVNGDGQLTGMPGLGDPPAVNARTPAPPQSSFGASVLRWFAWLGLMSVIAWAAVFAVRKVRKLRAARQPHYSFERN